MIESEYYKMPNELHTVTNIYEYSLLGYMFKLMNNGKNKYAFPSQGNISKVCGMCDCKVMSTTKSLELKGYIHVERTGHNVNKYTVDVDKILDDIRRNLSIDELGKRANREYTDKQKDAMTMQRNMLKPELAHRAEHLLGNKVYGKNGEIEALPIETGLNFSYKDGG
jgi:hypothetical protein